MGWHDKHQHTIKKKTSKIGKFWGNTDKNTGQLRKPSPFLKSLKK